MAPGWSGIAAAGAPLRRLRRAPHGAHRADVRQPSKALPLGLVDEVTPKGEALARATALAADIARRGPVAVQIVKAMINFAAEGEDRDAPIEGLAGRLDGDDGGSGRRRSGIPRASGRRISTGGR